jgi:DNA-binding XRE family transcriptional regulator
VTRQTVRASELGKYSPSLDGFRIARGFGVGLDGVFTFDERTD